MLILDSTEIIDIKNQHTTESAKIQDITMKYIPLYKDGKSTIFMIEAYVKADIYVCK